MNNFPRWQGAAVKMSLPTSQGDKESTGNEREPIKAAQIAILRELLESGPCNVGDWDIWATYNEACDKWRDHITAKIKELEGAGE